MSVTLELQVQESAATREERRKKRCIGEVTFGCLIYRIILLQTEEERHRLVASAVVQNVWNAVCQSRANLDLPLPVRQWNRRYSEWRIALHDLEHVYESGAIVLDANALPPTVFNQAFQEFARSLIYLSRKIRNPDQIYTALNQNPQFYKFLGLERIKELHRLLGYSEWAYPGTKYTSLPFWPCV